MATAKQRREQRRELARSEGVFSEFDVEDYIENRPLIRALAISEENAQVTIVRITEEHVLTRRELERALLAFGEFKIRHEQRMGANRSQVARLQESLDASRRRLDEHGRQSTIAIVVAWAGTVLVGFGVNLVTGDEQTSLGIGLLLLGALVEAVAFFIPRRRSENSDES